MIIGKWNVFRKSFSSLTRTNIIIIRSVPNVYRNIIIIRQQEIRDGGQIRRNEREFAPNKTHLNIIVPVVILYKFENFVSVDRTRQDKKKKKNAKFELQIFGRGEIFNSPPPLYQLNVVTVLLRFFFFFCSSPYFITHAFTLRISIFCSLIFLTVFYDEKKNEAYDNYYVPSSV